MTVGELRKALDGVDDNMVIVCTNGIITNAEVWNLGPLVDGNGYPLEDETFPDAQAFYIEIQEV